MEYKNYINMLVPTKRGVLSRNKSPGFTLIELLVVLAILSILMGLLGSNYLTSRIRARDAQRKSDLRSIGQALEMYNGDHGRYPAHEQVGAGNYQISGMPWGGSFYDPQEEETVYMQLLPEDPAAPATQYWYQANAIGTKFQLCAIIDNEQDSDIQQPNGYEGRICSEQSSSTLCNYCIASSNATVDEPITTQ